MANHTYTAELLDRINESYLISAFKIKPFGPVWKLSAPEGDYALKQFKGSPERIQELAGAMEWFKKAGFSHFASILAAKTGEPFITNAGRNYIITQWYPGENPEFRNPEHLTRVARLFGKMHFIGAKAPELHSAQSDGILKYLSRTEFLRRTITDLHQTRQSKLNRIDRAILKFGAHFLHQAEYCVAGILKCNTDLKFTGSLPAGFCHHDPAPRNIIIHQGDFILIDFDLSGTDFFINEFVTLLTRTLEANHWSHGLLPLICNAYGGERTLSSCEIQLLPYLLVFPQRFWRICQQRYHEKLSWTERRFERRLRQIISQEPKRLNFLEGLFPQEGLFIAHKDLYKCKPA